MDYREKRTEVSYTVHVTVGRRSERLVLKSAVDVIIANYANLLPEARFLLFQYNQNAYFVKLRTLMFAAAP